MGMFLTSLTYNAYYHTYYPGTPGIPCDACTFRMLFENPIKYPIGMETARKNTIPATAKISPMIGIKNNNIIAAAMAINIIITISRMDPIKLLMDKYTPNRVYMMAVTTPFDFPSMDFAVIMVSVNGAIILRMRDMMSDVMSATEFRILFTSSRMSFTMLIISPTVAVTILIV